MERSFIRHEMVILVLAVFGGLFQGTVAAERSDLRMLRSAMVLGVASDGTPFEVKSFYDDDGEVRFYTKVTVDPAGKSGRKCRLLYRWYSGDVVSLTAEVQKQLDVSPVYWLNSVQVARLAPGRHLVELYIDGRLSASGEFDVRGRDRPYEPEEETAIKDTAIALLLAGDTQHFDQLATRYRVSEERTASGNWKLSMLYNAIDQHSYAATDSRWRTLEELTSAWLAKQPDNPTATVLSARILRSHAWSWRGENEEWNVPAQNLQLYRQLLERARGVLDQHPGVAQQDPQWDTLRISIAREQGADSKEILAMSDRALARWPCFYALHNSVLNILRPQWGGSREDIQAYVKLALEYSRSREGTQAYARIYFYLARTSLRDPLGDLNALGAKWAPFKQSLAEVLQKYPSTFNRDIAQAMAGFGQDAAAYRVYGHSDTGGFFPVAWWDTHEWRQLQDAWAFEGKLPSLPISQRIGAYWSFLSGEGGPELWEPLRWGVFLVILFFEGGLRMLDWQAQRSVPKWSRMQGATLAFNLYDYPRVYLQMPVLGRASLRLGLWMSVFGAAAAYLITTVPWSRPVETACVLSGLIAVAVAGALAVVNVVTSRVVLRADDLELRRLFGRKAISRSEILGLRYYPTRRGLRVIALMPRAPGAAPLLVPPVVRSDDSFRLWFESLPLLPDDGDKEHGTRIQGR